MAPSLCFPVRMGAEFHSKHWEIDGQGRESAIHLRKTCSDCCTASFPRQADVQYWRHYTAYVVNQSYCKKALDQRTGLLLIQHCVVKVNLGSCGLRALDYCMHPQLRVHKWQWDRTAGAHVSRPRGWGGWCACSGETLLPRCDETKEAQLKLYLCSVKAKS